MRDAVVCEPIRTRMNVNGSGISLGHPVGATGGLGLAAVFERR